MHDIASILRALRRMSSNAEERGHHSLDRLDAKWIDAAIDLICDLVEKKS